MTPRLAQREIALGGLALLAAVVVVAIAAGRSSSSERRPEPVGSWQTAVAGIRAEGDFGQKTACGLILRSDTDGVSHGVLPCGAKIFISYGDRTVLTQVIDRGPSSPGRVFDLTPSVAAKLGVRSTARVRWAFAGTP